MRFIEGGARPDAAAWHRSRLIERGQPFRPQDLQPISILHSILLPLNIFRLAQIELERGRQQRRGIVGSVSVHANKYNRMLRSVPIRHAACNMLSTVRERGFDADPSQFGLLLGPLDDDAGVRPGLHVHVASKAPWFDISDDLPQFLSSWFYPG